MTKIVFTYRVLYIIWLLVSLLGLAFSFFMIKIVLIDQVEMEMFSGLFYLPMLLISVAFVVYFARVVGVFSKRFWIVELINSGAVKIIALDILIYTVVFFIALSMANGLLPGLIRWLFEQLF